MISIKKILYNFFSIKIAMLLFILFAISMATGTLLEEIYSTDTAHALIYHAEWFEYIMILIAIIFIINIFKYNFLSKKKIFILFFHLSFIFIFLGGAVSRYMGIDGVMHIRKGDLENCFLSNRKYLKILLIYDNKIRYYRDSYLFSVFHNTYKKNINIDGQIINIKTIKYIPFAEKVFKRNLQGNKYIKYYLVKNNKIITNYIQLGNKRCISDDVYLKFNYRYDMRDRNNIQIVEKKNILYIIFPIDGLYVFSGKKEKIIKNIFYPLPINNYFIINKNIFKINNCSIKGFEYYKSNYDNKNLNDVIYFNIYYNNSNYQYTVISNQDILNNEKYIYLNKKLKIKISYCPIYLRIPFYVFLNNFKLFTYPGSNNPSSFISYISILDDNSFIRKYSIYMNHIFYYKGYRFFQTSYDQDQLGTYLSISYDKWGTRISYTGYIILTISSLGYLLSKNSRFNKLHHNLIKTYENK